MFDYDARPVTPQVILVGNRASSAGYTIRDFLSRNGVPYDWVDLEDVERLPAVVSPSEMDPSLLPICILPNGIRLAPATLEDVGPVSVGVRPDNRGRRSGRTGSRGLCGI